MAGQSAINNVKCTAGKKITVVTALFLALVSLITIQAQNNTLYLIPSVPQANQLNPAYMHPCRIYVSLPVISSIQLYVRSTGFGFHDAVHTGTGAQSGTWYIDLDKLDSKLRRMNYLLANIDIDLLGVGISLKEWFFTFNISSHFSSQVSYPHDVVSLKDGNWNVSSGNAVPVRLNRLGASATAWNSIGVSASKEFIDGLRIGARIKYINGMANINTSRSAITLNTTSDPITLNANVNYKVNGSLPVTLGYTTEGLVSSVSFEPALHNLVSNYIFNKNRGLALDGGIVYDLDETTQVTASFTDLGFIWWRRNVNNLKGEGKFVFTGVNLDQYLNNPGQNDLINALTDSLLDAFHASNSKRGYVSALPLNLYGGITRELLPNIKAGAMTWIEINNLHIRPSLTLSLNLTPFKAFAATVSYTIMNNKLNQIGGGLAFGRKGAQFYILTDNIPVRFTKDVSSGLLWPYNARMISLRFGLNLFFGCEKKEKEGMRKSRYPRLKGKDDCPAYW